MELWKGNVLSECKKVSFHTEEDESLESITYWLCKCYKGYLFTNKVDNISRLLLSHKPGLYVAE